MVDENVTAGEGSQVQDTGGASSNGVADDVIATLRHNPFPGGEAPKGESAKADKGGKGKGNGAQTQAKGNVKQSPDGGQVAQPGTEGQAPDPEKDALRQSLDTANSLIEAYKGGRSNSQGTGEQPQGGTQKPAGGQRQDQGQQDGPKYDFNIPQQLVQALTSDKPEDFVMGLKGFATGVALAVHQQMLTQMKPVIENMLKTHVPQMLTPALEGYNTRKAIFDDFYGTYKELNNPRLYGTIAQTTQEVMTELKTNQWSPAVRDMVAKRVKDYLGAAVGATNGAPAVNTQEALPRHPKMGGGSSARGDVQQPDRVAEDIMSTLGFGNTH